MLLLLLQDVTVIFKRKLLRENREHAAWLGSANGLVGKMLVQANAIAAARTGGTAARALVLIILKVFIVGVARMPAAVG